MPDENSTIQPVVQPSVQPPTEDQPAAIPASPPTVVLQDNKPKKYFVSPKGRKFVATLFGLLILVGGASAGLLLVQQPQDVREKAAIPEECNALSTGGCANQMIGTPCGAGGTCNITGESQTCSCVVPTTVSCEGVKIYDANWVELTLSDLRALKTGSEIYLTATGLPDTAVFDKARFTINGRTFETANIRPGTTSTFYYRYRLLAGETDFVVTAQIHSVTLNDWI